MTEAPASSARSASASVCTSTSAVMPRDSTRSSRPDQGVLLECGDDQQDDVGAVGPRLVHLVAGDDEVLAQHGHVDDGADGVQVGLRPAEAPPLGEHADDAGAAGGVLGGQLGRVGDGGEVALGRAAPLDLGDDADARRAQRGEGIEGGPGVLGARPSRSASGVGASRAARSSRTPATISSRTFTS